MKTFDGYKKQALTDVYALLAGGGHKPLSEFSMAHTHPYLPLNGGTVTGNIILKGGTSSDMTYTGNVHPYIRFDNSDSSLNISLIFTDYDSYRRPAGIKLVGNQGSEWFEAANIYATTFYGALSGNATTATKLTSSAGNAALPIYFSDGKPVACTASSVFSNLSNNGNNLSITVAGQNRILTVGYASNSDTVDGYHASNIIQAGWINLMRTGGSASTIKWTRIGRFITTAGDNANNDAMIEFFSNGDQNYTYFGHGRLMLSSYSTGSSNIMLTSVSDGSIHFYATIDANRYIWLGHNAWWTGNSKYRVLFTGSFVEWYSSSLTTQTTNPNDNYITDNGTFKYNAAMSTSSSGSSHSWVWQNNLRVAYATSAGNADTVDGYHASSLWRSNGATWNPGANVSLNASGNNQEWSFDIRKNGYTGCYWHVWDSSLNTMLKVNADNGKVYAPYNFVGNLEGNASSASKWATARKITLSGSVTGNVSLDGSGDVTLATTTNHTHNWTNIEGKPSTFTPSSHTHSYITIPSCSTLNINSDNFSVEYAGGNNSVTTKPSGVDAFGVLKLRTAAGWYGQIMMSTNTAPGMYYRNANGLTSSIGWIKLLDSSNSNVSGGGSAWGSSITVNINGTSKTLTIPSNPNTDYRVTQSETTTTNYRPLVIGYTNVSTAGSGMTGSVTNQVYLSNKFYVQPSTGNLYATTFVGSLSGNASTATSATKLGTANVGATNVPIYLKAGVPTLVTLIDTANNLINNLTTRTSTPVDADYYVAQYVGGGTTTTTFHRRPHSALYNYIKGKANGTWGISITGNAATATTVGALYNTSKSDPGSVCSDGQNVKWFSSIVASSNYAGTNAGFPVTNNANGILWLGTHSGPYGWQMGFSSNSRIYARYINNNTFPTTANGGSWNKIAWTSDIPTKSSWNYDDRYSKLGHTHDDRYYTESEINSKLGAYLPLSGGTMTGNITYKRIGKSYIGNGSSDGANGVGGTLNNLVISSWYGVSFTTSCEGQTYTGTNAVSINCRNGYVYANTFVGSFSGNASTSTNADKIDGYHASDLVKFYLSPMATDASADSAKNWFTNTMPSGSGAIIYNVPGLEKTIIAGKSVGAYGHMLQLNYNDTYLRILRYYGGSWKSTDWEKISAGYADSAGNADTLDGCHASTFATTGHTHTLTLASDNGSNPINLAHGGKYKLTAGGSSIIFTLPTSNSVDPTNYYWANINISDTSSTSTAPRFGKVMINTSTSTYQLNVSGDSYVTGWSRAASGFTCTGYGVYFTHNNSVTSAGEIDIQSTNEFCWGSSDGTLHFNYRKVSRGTTVTKYIWNAGSSTSYASHTMGEIKATSITASGNIYAAHFYENSDIRYKRILRNLLINSNIIATLPLFDFEWIENNTTGTGTSAQAVQQILPNLVSGTDKLTLDYGVLGTIAGITACKELVTLKSELLQLKEKIKLLEDKLHKYENI